jgi:uncharacterized coiled-coil protein SlyX
MHSLISYLRRADALDPVLQRKVEGELNRVALLEARIAEQDLRITELEEQVTAPQAQKRKGAA